MSQRSAPTAEGAGARAATGKIGTTVEEKAPAVAPGRDQLRCLRKPGREGHGAAPLAEEVVARDKALKEAQKRITELEKTLKDLQKAVELKSQTGAQLQAQADAAKAQDARSAEDGAGAVPAPAPAVAAPSAKAPEPPKAAEPAKAMESAPAKTADPTKQEPTKIADATRPAAPKSDMAKLQPKPEPSFFDDLFGGTPAWVIGAGALAALGGIAALVAARRRKTTKFEDSIISGTDIKTNTVFGSTGGGVVNTGENSLASDFSREGLGNIDTDEVDPIAEAEVYLAYGRDAQAEEILKDALKKDPQRQEIYLKLLEIHAQHNKPSAFETVAAELYSVSHGQGEVWQKAVALGRQLDPNNPMFGEGSGAAAAAAAAAAGAAGAKAFSRRSAGQERRIARRRRRIRCGNEGNGRGRRTRLPLDEDVSARSGKAPNALDKIDEAERAFEESAKRAPASARSASEGLSSAAKGAAARRRDGALSAAKAFGGEKPQSRRQRTTSNFISTRARSPRRWASRDAMPRNEGDSVSPALARPQAAIDLDKLDLSFDPQHGDVRGSDAVGARRPVARRRHQARPREGVSGDGRRRRRARDPAGSAARGRRQAEVRSAVAAREARLTSRHLRAGGGASSAARFVQA